MKMRLGQRISVIELMFVVGLLLMVGGILTGCGGERAGEGEDTASEPSAEPVSQVRPAAPEPGGSVDAELAARGEALFRGKACVGCHTIGSGRLIGPDLQGVTERRTFDWIAAMMMNPDSMVKSDSIAKALFAEYATPMLPAQVAPDEAAAIYEYLRREGGD